MSIFEKKIDVFEAFGRLYGLERHQHGLYLVKKSRTYHISGMENRGICELSMAIFEYLFQKMLALIV